jgi:hypothetical protein
MTAFRPETMEVLDYKTGERQKIDVPVTQTLGKVSLTEGQAGTFEYAFMGKVLGTDSYKVTKIEKTAAGRVFHGETALELEGLSTKSLWRITEKGVPLYFKVAGKAGTSDYSVECEFSDDAVTVNIIQASQEFKRTVSLDGEVFLTDNNNLGLFQFILSGLDYEQGKHYQFRVFHSSSLQVLSLKIVVERREPISWQDKDHECWVLALELEGLPIKFWVDDQRRILRETEQNGRLVIERLGENN